VSEFEIEEAAEKFEDSKQLAEKAMFNLLENEVWTCLHYQFIIIIMIIIINSYSTSSLSKFRIFALAVLG